MRFSRYLCLSLFFILSLFSSYCGAQSPFITTYQPDDYQSGDINFDVAQDQNGVIYVANSEGVMVYDGKKWITVPVSGRVAREVLFSPKHGLLVGTLNDVGRIEQNETKQYVYKSLKHLFPENGKSLRTVFALHELDGKIFIETQQSFYVYDGVLVVAHPFTEYISHSYVVKNNVYVFCDENLYVYQYGVFKKKLNFKEANLANLFLLFQSKDGKLIGVNSDATFIEFNQDVGSDYKTWNTKTDVFMKNADIYLNFLASPDHDRLYFPTHTNKVYVIDFAGNPIQLLSTENGLIGSSIHNVFLDREKNVWLASNKGLSKLTYELPFEKFDENNGLISPLHSVTTIGDSIYVGSDNGLFLSSDHGKHFSLLAYPKYQIWEIQPYGKGMLVAAGNLGLAYWEGGKELFVFTTPTATMTFSISNKDESIVYLGLYSGISVLRFSENGFKLIKSIPTITERVSSILEDAEHRVWIGTKFNGFYMLPFSTTFSQAPFHYGLEKGLHTLEHNYVFGNSRNVWFTVKDSIYAYNSSADRFFSLQDDLSKRIKHTYPILVDDGNGYLWSLTDKLVLDKRNPTLSDSTSLQFFKDNLVDVSRFKRDEYYILAKDALFKAKLPISVSTTAGSLQITYCKELGGDVFFSIRDLENNQHSITVGSNINSIEIGLSYPSYIQEKQTRFRYRITENNVYKSTVKQWSSWQYSPQILVSGLGYGSYHVEVEALNGIGKFSQLMQIELNRPIPIYLHPISLAFYLFSISGLIYGFVYIRNRQILKRNEYLEELVQLRTDEVVNQNAELKFLASEMAKANQFKSSMLQMAVHDLRNPLAVLSGYCDLLQDDVPKQQKIAVLQNMDRVLDKLLNSIDTLLTVNEKGHTKNGRERVKIDLNSLVLDVIKENSVLAAKKRQAIQSDLDSACFALVDRYQLHEVFDNLVNNAIKYAPFDTPILIKLNRKKAVSGSTIIFSVKDQGPGLRQEDHTRIFTEYARSENKPTGDEKSSGLGLSIVKEIVQWHDGKVWVESNPEKYSGSTFFVELPAVE